MSLVQIFIATYNRPTLAIKAINSALSQDFGSFEVIVSDNSTNDNTFNLIKALNLSGIRYIKRSPSLSAISHLNAILDSVQSDFFMIFHDDDLMHENMIKELFYILSNNKDVIAAGSNATVYKNGKIYRKYFCKRLKKNIRINSMEEMIVSYSLPAYVPFPGYLYRKVVAQNLRFNFENGGKHCDVAFIIDLLSLGPVIFLAKPLMDYNLHDGQDSAASDFNAYLQLIRYILKKMKYHRTNPVILRLRIQNIYSDTKFNLQNHKLIVGTRRYFLMMRILLKYSPFEYFIKILIITLYSQIMNVFCKN